MKKRCQKKIFKIKKNANRRTYIDTECIVPGLIEQWVKCLTVDMCLTADPGVATSIPGHSSFC